ncbi:hypothetical protein BJ741DRAFT_579870 [Chytriomyces cf. hyalinus JEL632]|nr:hypothetical protein BJ741DRAFT_579870 [Chytriomyces cf. hyalinus JEL632]
MLSAATERWEQAQLPKHTTRFPAPCKFQNSVFQLCDVRLTVMKQEPALSSDSNCQAQQHTNEAKGGGGIIKTRQLAANRHLIEVCLIATALWLHAKQVLKEEDPPASSEQTGLPQTKANESHAVDHIGEAPVLGKPDGARHRLNPLAAKFVPASAKGLNVYAPEFYPSSPFRF